jgi:RNA polymerase sigma-70 factor (ECF subfamily)
MIERRRTGMGHFRSFEHLLIMEWVVAEQIPTDMTVSAAASGDEMAFARLIAAHHSPMVRAAFVVTGDAATAREAAQNAWSIAWTRLGTVREPARIREWLVAISANEARQLARRSQRRQVREIRVDGFDPVAGDPAEDIDLVDLERALGGLSLDDRRLLALRYVAGLDSTVIASRLGMSASGVRSRLSRTLERLRRELDGV